MQIKHWLRLGALRNGDRFPTKHTFSARRGWYPTEGTRDGGVPTGTRSNMGASTKQRSILRVLFAMTLLSGSVLLVGGVKLEDHTTFTNCISQLDGGTPCTSM